MNNYSRYPLHDRRLHFDKGIKDIMSQIANFRETLSNSAWWKPNSINKDFESILDFIGDMESVTKNTEIIVEEELYWVIDECDKLSEQVSGVLNASEQKKLLNDLKYGIIGGRPSEIEHLQKKLESICPNLSRPRIANNKAAPPASSFNAMFAEVDILLIFTAYTSHSMTGLASNLARALDRKDWLLYANRDDNIEAVVSRIISMRQRQLKK